MKKYLLLIMFINSFAINNSQIKVLKTSYNVAKQYSSIDNRTFENTICSIILGESSAGKFIIGDSYFNSGKEKPFLLKSLGIGQVKLETVIIVIRKYPQFFNDEIKNLINYENPFIYKKYAIYFKKIDYFQNIYYRYNRKKHKTKRDLRVIKWSKKELKYYKRKVKPYKKQYEKDIQLAQYLLTDYSFNVKIMTIYFIHLYNTYKLKGYKDPYHIAISRYNGGLNNVKYKNKIHKKYLEWLSIKKKIYKN